MVDFHHKTITTPAVTTEYRILQGLTMLTNAVTNFPTAQSDVKLQAITSLYNAFGSWELPGKTPDQTPLPDPASTCQSIRVQKIMLKQPKIKHPIPPQPTPRVPNKPAPCDPDPRVLIQHN